MFKSVEEIPADLCWLAENVHKWESDHCSVDREFYEHIGHIASFRIGPAGKFTRDQWQAARDLISGKPGWGEAPEWAQCKAQCASGFWVFYEREPIPDGDVWEFGVVSAYEGHHGTVLGDWRDTLERRPTDHTNELLDGGAPEEGEEREEPLADLYPKYYKDVTGLHSIDVYMTHKLFGIDDPSGCIQHASKKLLLSGVRTGGKSKFDDIREARDTLTRWLEINE